MNTYNTRLAQLAEDLINTYDTFLDEPEHLQSPAELEQFLQEHAISGDVDEDVLDAVRALRGILRAAWTGDDLATILAILNPLLANARITPYLQVDEDEACYMEYVTDGNVPLIEHLAFQAALGISVALQAYGIERLLACAAEPCRDVYIDTSRNRSRRFCSNRCANRYNVQAFRSRRQDDT